MRRKWVICCLMVLAVQLLITWVSATRRHLSNNHDDGPKKQENGSSPDSFDVKVIPGQSVLKDLQGIERTEAKTRASYKEERKIGSRPPNCEHKCYGCSPCEAVQVPTITGHFSIQYANYFPEGWNCKCGPSFYSP